MDKKEGFIVKIVKRLLGIGALGGIALIIYGCTLPNSAPTVFGGIALTCGCLAIIGPIWAKEGKRSKEMLTEYMSYDTGSATLTIKKRDKGLQDILNTKGVIKICDDQNYSSHVTPTKLHIGAATVGGVTTGGTYTTGGQRVVDGHYKTGLCYLEYCDVLFDAQHYSKGHIKRIVLFPSVLKDAKESSVQKYLSGDTIIVEQSSKMSLDEMRYAMEDLNSAFTQSTVKRGYPTREKCNEILNWLKSY